MVDRPGAIRPSSASSPRARLHELIAREGPGLLDDPLLVRERLEAALPDQPEKRQALLAAWRERIPQELLDLRGQTLSALVRRELAHRLARRQNLSETLAAWSVQAWAEALGVRFAPAGSPVPKAPGAPLAEASPPAGQLRLAKQIPHVLAPVPCPS